MSNVEEMAARIDARLRALGSPRGIAAARRFFKEEVDPYGVSAPQIRELAREIYREAKAWPAAHRNKLCTALWRNGKLESGAFVAYFYARFAKQCGHCEFKLFETWIDKYVSNWAHTDSVCTLLTEASIRNEPALALQLPAWTASKNRWKRRAAAVSLVKAGRRGEHLETILHVAGLMIEDKDEMVQKGVGWLLKETHQTHPSAVVEFLHTQKARAPRLLLRYAAEKMTAAERKRVLG
ncbi:MAG: DNA alkylation repair protein [Bryobacterales bacterium]|nr:DNA alkylation repair protein [Bryobacterales bacterium]